MELTRYYAAFGLRIASDFSLPALRETSPAPPDLRIRRGAVPAPVHPEPTKVYRAGLQARAARPGDGELWLDWSPVATYAAHRGRELTVAAPEPADERLALFTLSEALGLILFQRGFVLLHGSAVALGGRGVVFLGVPGAGKSTTAAAFAQRGGRLLSDDLVCLQLDAANNPWVVPAFAQLKLWQKSVDGLGVAPASLVPVAEGASKFAWQDADRFKETAVPLARVCVLTNDPADPAQPLPKSAVPVELLRYFPLPDVCLQGSALRAYFQKTAALAEATPLHRVQRPADFAALYAFVEHLKTAL